MYDPKKITTLKGIKLYSSQTNDLEWNEESKNWVVINSNMNFHIHPNLEETLVEATMDLTEEQISKFLDVYKQSKSKTYLDKLKTFTHSPQLRIFSEDFLIEKYNDIRKAEQGELLKFEHYYKDLIKDMPALKLLMEMD